jgi:hypothetical protein
MTEALYQLVIDGNEQWIPRSQVGAVYDNGWVKVDFGRWVIDNDTRVPRGMTKADQDMIADAADRHSENK